METKDPYKALGLSSRDASQEDIRKAHRKLVRKYHPDANPGDDSAEQRFKKLQQAYEVLSDEQKRREYDEGLRTSPGRSSGRPRSRESASSRRAGAGGRTAGGSTAGGSTHTVDLSELLGKLANLSSEGTGGRKGGSYELQGEEVAHLAKLLGEKIPGISAFLGKDTARLSKLLGENIKMNAKASFGNARSSQFSTTDEDISGRDPSAAGKEPREKKVKGPGVRGREKRVKGPGARRRGRSS
jgi:curved DNA-binding protein CbpA